MFPFNNFVSRERLTEKDQQIGSLTMQLADLQARHDLLTDKYVELATPKVVTLPERTRDQVIEAILNRAGSNGQLRAHLSHWAMEQRKQGIPDDSIIQGITIWASPDDEVESGT